MEVDFAWIVNESYPQRTTIILGECKDRGRKNDGGDGGTIDARDIANLKALADALPKKRFETYVVLAKLCEFTEDEIAAARTINEPYRPRAILLTHQELEPWHIYDRIKKKRTDLKLRGGRASELARGTAMLYFSKKRDGG
jgi:hypothetical protein